jgi:hypothetical protein
VKVDLKNKAQLKALKSSLDDAKWLIENSDVSDVVATQPKFKSLSSQLQDTESLLTRCAQVVEKQNAEQKPILRVIHHFACSGGTLISKCLSSMPNVFLLSEVHPTSKNHMAGKPKYLPSDITSLARYANVPEVDELAIKLFINNIVDTETFVRERGGILVLREHTHIDFCLGDKVTAQSAVDDCLNTHFKLKHLVTVRNPIDAYMSLVINGWVQFTPPSFDEYCKRLLEFINRYPNKTIVKYEDFVKHPDKKLRKICKILALPFDDRFGDIFDVFTVTGDSGRKGDNIEMRERRPIELNLLSEIKRSKNFRRVAKVLKYEKDF